MVDFPDEVWINSRSATVYIDGSSAVSGRDREFAGGQQYIRADLVPQWQPIETVPINTPVLAVVRNEPEYGRVAIVGSSFPDKLKLHYSHWMPIPKVQK